jgi:hypothetical protein
MENSDNITIIKTLGKGLYGTTYEIKYNNKKYALKRQKILKSYIEGGTKYPMWREFKFFSWINKLDKHDQKFFMKLISYKFYSGCDFSNQNENYPSKLIQKLNKSKHCLDMIFDLKDGVLGNILYELSFKQYCSMCIQVLYAIYLMDSAKYVHNDLHLNNIAYTKVDRKKLIVLNINGTIYKIKSYGYQFSIIDYGLIIHKNFDLNIEQRKRYDNYVNYNRDFSMFFIYTLSQTRFAIKKKFNIQIFDAVFYRKELYQRIKLSILSLYPNLAKSYLEYEKKGKIDRFLLYEVVQFLAIYDKKLLCKILKKKYWDNILPNSVLEYIKLNMTSIKSLGIVLQYLLDNNFLS